MSTFLIVIGWLALFHFVYESILAPSFRMSLRNKLFVVRDELRDVKINGIAEEDEEAFWLVHGSVNGFLSLLPNLTMSRQISAVLAYRRRQVLRDQVHEHYRVICHCKDAGVHRAMNRTVNVVSQACVVNSGAWFVYVVPVAVLALTLGTLKRIATDLVLLPERAANRLLSRPC